MHKKLAAEAEASAELAALEEEKVFADFKATICDEGYGQQRGRPNVPPPAALPPPPGGAPNYASMANKGGWLQRMRQPSYSRRGDRVGVAMGGGGAPPPPPPPPGAPPAAFA